MVNLDFCDKHNMVAYLQNSKGSEGFHQIIDFLTTSHISTLENRDMEITANNNGKSRVSFTGKGSQSPIEDPSSRPISASSLHNHPTLPPSMQTTYVAEETATIPHDSPLLRLEQKVKSSKARRRVRLVVSEDEDDLEDPSKQGRKIAQLDKNEGITLRFNYRPALKVKTAAESLVYIRISAAKRKDKGKVIMKEAGTRVNKKTKLQLDQQRLGLEEAMRLQEQLDEEERQRIARVHEEASTFNAEEWGNIQAQIKADEDFAHRLQAQERERYSEADKNSKRDAEQELNQESSKRQKIGEGSEPAKESKR
ncbi:hypothetical protein Tco_0520431 [Tanacetum coccineum]